MNNNRINIKRILLGILAIAITITIGIGIAKAEVAPARLNLDRGNDLSLHDSDRASNLRLELNTRLTRDALLDVVAFNQLSSYGRQPDALNNRELARLDALNTFDNLNGLLLN